MATMPTTRKHIKITPVPLSSKGSMVENTDISLVINAKNHQLLEHNVEPGVDE